MSKFDISESLLRKFAKLIEDAGLTEIEFEEEGRRLRLTKQTTSAVVAPQIISQGVPTVSTPPAPSSSDSSTSNSVQINDPDGFVVESAMVGTAYSASEPGKLPFVAVGDRVTEGQTLLIIEAMKFMNQVPSPKAGAVKEILFKDGDAIEFGQPLIVLGE